MKMKFDVSQVVTRTQTVEIDVPDDVLVQDEDGLRPPDYLYDKDGPSKEIEYEEVINDLISETIDYTLWDERIREMGWEEV